MPGRYLRHVSFRKGVAVGEEISEERRKVEVDPSDLKGLFDMLREVGEVLEMWRAAFRTDVIIERPARAMLCVVEGALPGMISRFDYAVPGIASQCGVEYEPLESA